MKSRFTNGKFNTDKLTVPKKYSGGRIKKWNGPFTPSESTGKKDPSPANHKDWENDLMRGER